MNIALWTAWKKNNPMLQTPMSRRLNITGIENGICISFLSYSWNEIFVNERMNDICLLKIWFAKRGTQRPRLY